MINLSSIYNSLKDDAIKGLCCSNVKYYSYPQAQCVGEKCKEEEMRKRLFPPAADQDFEFLSASNCLEIFIFQQVFWRICNRSEDKIIKLKQTIEFQTLRTVPGINEENLISNN
jgi:hypothetical protein